jgi:hypothetical protein
VRATAGVRALVCECLRVCEQARKLPTDLLARLRRYLYFKQVGDLRCRNTVQRVLQHSPIRLVDGLRSPSSYTIALCTCTETAAAAHCRAPISAARNFASTFAFGVARNSALGCGGACGADQLCPRCTQSASTGRMASGAVSERMGGLVRQDRPGANRGGTCCGIRS